MAPYTVTQKTSRKSGFQYLETTFLSQVNQAWFVAIEASYLSISSLFSHSKHLLIKNTVIRQEKPKVTNNAEI